MKRLSSLDLKAIKRPAVLISLAVLVVVALGWWFAWMSPEGGKLASIKEQQTAKQSDLDGLRAELATSRYDLSLLQKNGAYLRLFAAAVPAIPEAQVLTTQIFQLATRTVGAHNLKALSDNTTVPPGKGAALGQIPLSITIQGGYSQCLAFLDGIYKLPRLITVNSISPTPATGSNGSSPNLLQVNNTPFQMQVSATAYYSPLIG